MQFSILGVFSVLLELARPFLWIIVVLILLEALIAWRLINSNQARISNKSTTMTVRIALVSAIISLLLAPFITGATFASLNGWLDYSALLAIGVVVFTLSVLLIILPVQYVFSFKSKV